MKHILNKLTKEEVKELSKAIQKSQTNKFGNPLSLRKQEELMADIFQEKNWSTVLGLAQGISNEFSTLKGMVSNAMKVLSGKPKLEGKKWKEYAQTLEKERADIVDCLCWASVLVKEESSKRENSKKKKDYKCIICDTGRFVDCGENVVPRYSCYGCGHELLTCVEFFVKVRDGELTKEEARAKLLAEAPEGRFFHEDKLNIKEIRAIELCVEMVKEECVKSRLQAATTLEWVELVNNKYEELRSNAIKSLNRANEDDELSECDNLFLEVESTLDKEKIKMYLEREDF